MNCRIKPPSPYGLAQLSSIRPGWLCMQRTSLIIIWIFWRIIAVEGYDVEGTETVFSLSHALNMLKVKVQKPEWVVCKLLVIIDNFVSFSAKMLRLWTLSAPDEAQANRLLALRLRRLLQPTVSCSQCCEVFLIGKVSLKVASSLPTFSIRVQGEN